MRRRDRRHVAARRASLAEALEAERRPLWGLLYRMPGCAANATSSCRRRSSERLIAAATRRRAVAAMVLAGPHELGARRPAPAATRLDGQPARSRRLSSWRW